MAALKITVEGIRRTLTTINVVVSFTPTLKDDAVMAKVNPIAERIIANNEFQTLLDFVNSLSSHMFGSASAEAAAVPDGYDAEGYTALAEMILEDAKRQAA